MGEDVASTPWSHQGSLQRSPIGLTLCPEAPNAITQHLQSWRVVPTKGSAWRPFPSGIVRVGLGWGLG